MQIALNLSKHSEINSTFIACCQSASIGFSSRLENSGYLLSYHLDQFSPTVGSIESNARILFAAAAIILYRRGTPISYKRVKY
jgi:hypothetical protein